MVVVGIGGVGSWAAEALARSGVGRLTLVDLDHVAESNINRQVHALDATLGQAKVQAMAEHVQKHTIGEHETWVVENESKGGYGVTLTLLENDWVRLDALMGVRPENTDRWQLAAIRRLSRLPDGHMYAGVKVLAYAPVTVDIKMRHARSSGYSIDGIDSSSVTLSGIGVFTPAKSNAQKVNGLVMRASDYQPLAQPHLPKMPNSKAKESLQ